MGHPSEYFIRYSLAQVWGNEEIETTMVSLNTTLKSFGLLELTEHHYDTIKATFHPPEGFRFANKKHKPSRDFMVSERIHALWIPKDDDARVLKDIVDGNQLVKHDLHILLMGNLPHDVIVAKLNGKYRLNPGLTARMVETYKHFFWNVTHCSYDEWDVLLNGKAHKDACMAALYCGEQQALYRTGFSPRVDGNRAMKEAYRQAFFRMEALRFQPDAKTTTDAYSKLTARLLGVHDVLYSAGTGLQDQLKQFRQLMMKHNDPDVKAIDAVIDKVGSYSDDGDVHTSESEEEPQQGDLQ